ncbi:helix-turn-helix domain-containing protein [Aurantibacter crassamenti]|uniref:AraC family transcriptional regulator n=1 Tax=Aurantibacter crassamenti TaxID=1837375 RepID=UPI00193AB98F|nr:AraC family transcriptional regulator [Aurantibacter crassamenti]MBM1104928.1 helix-turn-helix domain-containing protein [Aurantibacter crassamenti]
MKIQLESFNDSTKSPFRLLHDPKLNHLYFWHFHPEYELVYIEGANAKRHVGNHMSQFQESDLVLIGSNIPHLNFDHNVTSKYRKEVLHIKQDFKKTVIAKYPELQSLNRLMELSKFGIAFSGATKIKVGKFMKKLHYLDDFEFFMEVIRILKELSTSTEFELLHKTPYTNPYSEKEQKRFRKIYGFVDVNFQKKIVINDVASLCNLSKPAFCRYFKKSTGNTFINFLNQYRISQAKHLLLLDKNITETCYECGFESLSYFNRIFKRISGENPTEFKKRNQIKKNSYMS